MVKFLVIIAIIVAAGVIVAIKASRLSKENKNLTSNLDNAKYELKKQKEEKDTLEASLVFAKTQLEKEQENSRNMIELNNKYVEEIKELNNKLILKNSIEVVVKEEKLSNDNKTINDEDLKKKKRSESAKKAAETRKKNKEKKN